MLNFYMYKVDSLTQAGLHPGFGCLTPIKGENDVDHTRAQSRFN